MREVSWRCPSWAISLRRVYDDGTLGVSRSDLFTRPANMPRYDCNAVDETEEMIGLEEDEFFD